MDILKNLNNRLTIVEGAACYGGEENIKKVVSESPIRLPEDYIEFLKCISGGDGVGISFLVDETRKEIGIWNAWMTMEKREEFYAPFLPSTDEFLESVWLIGDDLGDLVYFYGEGKDGFGLYRVEAGSLCFEDADKIADTLTDFLVKGVGIDVAVTLSRK